MAKKGEKLKKETKEKIRKKALGRKLSETAKKKISLSKKGHTWNRGRKHTEQMREKTRLARLGTKTSEETKEKIRMRAEQNPNWGGRGLKRSKEHCKKLSEARKGKWTGEKNPSWNGGTSFEEYDLGFNREFKKSIKERDGGYCMVCGDRNIIAIHHIDYKKKNTTKQNCISLCVSCHGKTCWNRKQWTMFFKSLLNSKYGYKYD